MRLCIIIQQSISFKINNIDCLSSVTMCLIFFHHCNRPFNKPIVRSAMILADARFVLNLSFPRGNSFSGGFLNADTMKVQFSNAESAIMYSVPENVS